MMSKINSTYTINFALLIFLLISFGGNSVKGQCENSYSKPTERIIFSERVNFIPSSSADFNEDGLMDLVGLGYEKGTFNADKIYIAPSNMNGSFDALISVPIPPTNIFSPPTSTDFDGDGDLDLVSIESGPEYKVLILKNNGLLNFTPQTTFTVGSGEFVGQLVDIDNDGIADLLTGQNSTQGFASFYRLGEIDGNFGERVQIANASFNIAADFNNDGFVDFPQQNSSGNLSILYNQGKGVFQTQSTNINLGNSNLSLVKDVNNDGLPDLIAREFNQSISVLVNNGSSSFTKSDYQMPPITTTGFSIGPQLSGDFNGDGFIDLLTFSNSKPYYSILKNDGTGLFIRTDYNVRALGIPFGDINGDNKTDFIRINNLNLQSQFFTGKLFNETQVIFEENSCEKKGATAIVDFDADRTSDRTHWNANQGLWKSDQLNLNDGTRDFVNYQWGIIEDIPTPGDFDGDGVTDYAVYRPSNGVWYINRSSDSTIEYIRFGISEDIPVPFDFDGDEKTDVAVFRPSLGNWYIIQSDTQQTLAFHWGISEDKPVPADFDGDNKADIAVYRPSEGNWYIVRSSDNEYSIVNWGISEDQPLPADYDGDGKADITVFRSSERIWYVLRSYNGQFSAFAFGLSDDIPQPGDWNGDGIMELGVYRPSQNAWYSSNTNGAAIFGSSNDMPFGTLQKIY